MKSLIVSFFALTALCAGNVLADGPHVPGQPNPPAHPIGTGVPAPAPYHPAPAPYNPGPAPAPYHPAPTPYYPQPQPQPYHPAPAPYYPPSNPGHYPGVPNPPATPVYPGPVYPGPYYPQPVPVPYYPQPVPAPYYPPVVINNSGLTIQGLQSGLCLDVTGGSTAQGAQIIQAYCDNTTSQQFTQVAMGDGSFALRNVNSGLCIDTQGYGSSYLIQWSCNYGSNQRFVERSQSYGVSLVSQQSNLCVDVSGGATYSGAPVITYNCQGSPNQGFLFR